MDPSLAPKISLLELGGSQHKESGEDGVEPGHDVSRLLLVPARVKDTTSPCSGNAEEGGIEDLTLHHPAPQLQCHPVRDAGE